MGRPPIGKVAMTGAERIRRYRLKQRQKLQKIDQKLNEQAAKATFLMNCEMACAVASQYDGPVDAEIIRNAEVVVSVWTELAAKLKAVPQAEKKKPRKRRKDSHVAEISPARMQSIAFDTACRLIAEMTPDTRSKFRHYWDHRGTGQGAEQSLLPKASNP